MGRVDRGVVKVLLWLVAARLILVASIVAVALVAWQAPLPLHISGQLDRIKDEEARST